MTRRGAGEGSIFKDPKNGRWRALVDVGADASGKRQRKKVSGRTRAEVLLKMRELQRDAEDGLASGGRHLTVAALSEEWLRHGSGELSASTLTVRTWAVRQHLVPALGARRVRQLSAEDVSLFLLDLAQAGYAKAGLEKVRGVLIQVLRHAERQGLVARNVAAIVPTPAGPRAEGRFGLKWEDVDLDRGVLRVSRAVSRVGGKVALSQTKTASSRRQLRLPAGTEDVPRQHRTRQQARQDVMGEHWQDLGLVFPTGCGTLVDPANLRRTLGTVTEKAGLGHWHPHELRHSAASLLSAAGVPLEEIADVLGHASTRVTSATYRHRTTPTVEAGAGPMNEILRAGLKGDVVLARADGRP